MRSRDSTSGRMNTLGGRLAGRPDGIDIAAIGDPQTYGYNVVTRDAWPQVWSRCLQLVWGWSGSIETRDYAREWVGH